MCSTDFGVLDLLFDKEDPTCKGLEGFRNTLFSSSGDVLDINDVDVKEEVLDSGTIDWKLSSEWDADELLRSVLDGDDMTACPPTLTTCTPSSSTLDPLPPSSLQPPDDMDSLEDLVGLPFHAVLDSGASDSGMSSDSSLDQQMSPGSGYSVSSPESVEGFSSPDPGHDTTSDLSGISDLAFTSPSSFTNFPASPEPLHAADDFLLPDSGFSSPVRQGTSDPVIVTPNTFTTPATVHVAPAPAPITVTTPAATVTPVTRTVVTKAKVTPTTLTHNTVSGTPLLKTVTVGGTGGATMGGTGAQTIVVTQGGTNNNNNTINNNNNNKGNTTTAQLVRGPTILKSSGQTSRSILLPVTVKDLNQVRTIKIISTGGNGGVGGRGVRTVVSTVRTPTTTTTNNNCTTTNVVNNNNTNNTLNTQSFRTALLGTVRGHENGKSLLKGGASTLLTTTNNTGRPTVTTTTSSPTRVKLEPHEDDDDDDDDDDGQPHTAFQQLTLSDEEKRLLKKEGILLPSHYPLTKQEERELKRIRRKIRNKISAQDSRKRKKEYIDGLEDRVKACTEENQQLQKRIKSLEAQNETLLNQVRRFQTAVTGGSSGRLQTHASTALMMLILSAALFIVPAVRQDNNSSTDSEMSLHSSKMPSAGHSRSLLEAGNVGVVPDALDVLESVDDDVAMEVEIPLVEALSDHDYIPVAKKQRTISSSSSKMSPYYVPPLDDFPPRHGKPDTGGGFPPDDGSVAKMAARIMDSMVDQVTNNYSDPGGKQNNNNNNGQAAVVVKLGQGRKRLRDDIELE